MLHLTLTTLEATERLGGLLADSMRAAACRVLLMHGDLGSGKTTLTRALVAPGLWMQRLTVKEPDDKMMEAAITAMEAVIPENGEDLLR